LDTLRKRNLELRALIQKKIERKNYVKNLFEGSINECLANLQEKQKKTNNNN